MVVLSKRKAHHAFILFCIKVSLTSEIWFVSLVKEFRANFDNKIPSQKRSFVVTEAVIRFLFRLLTVVILASLGFRKKHDYR